MAPTDRRARSTSDEQPRIRVTVDAKPTEVFEGEFVALTAHVEIYEGRYRELDDQNADDLGTLKSYTYVWSVTYGDVYQYKVDPDPQKPWIASWRTSGAPPRKYEARVSLLGPEADPETGKLPVAAVSDPPALVTVDLRRVSAGETQPVSMRRSATPPTQDLPLWVVIRKSTNKLAFQNYDRYMSIVLCGDAPREDEAVRFELDPQGRSQKFEDLWHWRALPYTDADAYRALKAATEAFLMINCATTLSAAQYQFTDADASDITERVAVTGRDLDLKTLWNGYLRQFNGGDRYTTVPYLALIRKKFPDLNLKQKQIGDPTDTDRLPEQCFGILQEKLASPCFLELIWSYWMEEGMLAQTLNAITLRFQNIRSRSDRDPLAMLEIDPLRPLNNLLWGYIQDEQHRLSLKRRAYEYDHHYGLRLVGKAVRDLRPADSRSRFIEAFHKLLHLCAIFFQQDDDTTVVADGFPLLNVLKEVHLLLSQGAHNQYGDLPSTARIEMLMQQWLLARPEFREFLPTRIMVAYPEPWMDRVEAMKTLQGWTDDSILHFRNLALFGEQVLLSIRYGNWSDVIDPFQAANWARYWRAEIQGYTFAYLAVSGVDLTSGSSDASMPSARLQERLARQAGSRR
jgi:hypothetical protein